MSEMDNSTDRILTLGEVADYLKVAEKTILRMIGNREIPCAKVGNQWRFRKDVLDSWLLTRMRLDSSSALADAVASGEYLPLSRVTEPSLISVTIRPGSKREVLAQLAEVLAGRRAVGDVEAYVEALLNREALASTGIGAGVAIPHVRNPESSPTSGPDLVVGICPKGTAFEALDDRVTQVLFLVSSNSIAVHLKLMSRISRLARNNAFMKELIRAGTPKEVWSLLLRHDERELAEGRR